MAPRTQKPTRRCSCDRENCDAEERVRNTANVLGNSLNAAALILSTFKSVADFGCTPGLKGACGTMLSLIAVVQEMQDVQDGFGALLHSICRFLVIVVRYDREQEAKGQKLNANLRRSIKEFNGELKKIKAYVEQRGKRGWLKRLISSSMDKGKLQELRARFEDTCGLFHTEMMMDTNHHVHLVAGEFETRFQAIEDQYSMQDLHDHTAGASSVAQQQQPYQQQPYDYSHQSYGYEPGHQQAGYYDYQQQAYEPHSYLQGYGGPPGYSSSEGPASYAYPYHQPPPPAGPNVNNIGSVKNVNFGTNYGTKLPKTIKTSASHLILIPVGQINQG
ncbi:hypothetical protein MD484_g7744, partial [Candolleomyces efflorescens]